MIVRPRPLSLALLAGLVACAGLGACGPALDERLAEIQALQANGKYADTVEPLREILAKNPGNPEANYLLGVALMQSGRTSDAVWSLRKASESDAYAIEGGILLASALVTVQANDEALAATDRVLEKDPSRFAAWGVRAQAHLAAGDLPAALADADKLKELQPTQVQGDLLRAVVLLRLDRLVEAEQAYDTILEKAKANGDVVLGARACVERAALIQQRLHDEARAEQAIAACVHDYPTDPGVLHAASDLYTGWGRPEEGTKLWQAAVRQAPDSIPLRLGLAQELALRGHADEAEATLAALAKDFASSSEAWKALSDFQRRRGELDRAQESMDKAVELSGNDERMRFLRGDLLVSRGDLDGAEAVVAGLPDGAPRDLLRG
ncbi:MAG TPA: tetratricopeptide repeat protein, partial [Myxococcota bacterium]|nr:tetratricopeptide repeat protein [Myxococcota bacterium]